MKEGYWGKELELWKVIKVLLGVDVIGNDVTFSFFCKLELTLGNFLLMNTLL